MPTSPIPPFKLGEKTDDPLQMYLADIFTVSANLAGLPGISMPVRVCGTRTAPRLPIGFQLIGRMFDEATMLRVADAYRACDGLGDGSGASLNCRLFAPFPRADFRILHYDRRRYDTDRPTRFAHATRRAGRRLEPAVRPAVGSATGAADTTKCVPRLQALQGEDERRRDQRRHRRLGSAGPAAARRAAEPHHVAAGRAEAGRDTHGRSCPTCAATATAASRRTARATSTTRSARWRSIRSR